MSEHNEKLRIDEIFYNNKKLKSLTIIDSNNKTYAVSIDDKSKSIIPIAGGEFDTTEIFKFVNDFIKEIETNV